jgi:hypothetical protein
MTLPNRFVFQVSLMRYAWALASRFAPTCALRDDPRTTERGPKHSEALE